MFNILMATSPCQFPLWRSNAQNLAFFKSGASITVILAKPKLLSPVKMSSLPSGHTCTQYQTVQYQVVFPCLCLCLQMECPTPSMPQISANKEYSSIDQRCAAVIRHPYMDTGEPPTHPAPICSLVVVRALCPSHVGNKPCPNKQQSTDIHTAQYKHNRDCTEMSRA